MVHEPEAGNNEILRGSLKLNMRSSERATIELRFPKKAKDTQAESKDTCSRSTVV